MRRKARAIVYVCSAIKDGNLISKSIETDSVNDSCNSFSKEFGLKPETVYGPFYKKKTGILKKNIEIRFKFGQNKQGTYNGWNITAIPLASPEDSMYLLYNNRIDGQKMQKPNSIIIKENEIEDLK